MNIYFKFSFSHPFSFHSTHLSFNEIKKNHCMFLLHHNLKGNVLQTFKSIRCKIICLVIYQIVRRKNIYIYL